MRSRRYAPQRLGTRRSPAGSNVIGKGNNSQTQSVNLSLTISGYETTSAGRSSTAEGPLPLPKGSPSDRRPGEHISDDLLTDRFPQQ